MFYMSCSFELKHLFHVFVFHMRVSSLFMHGYVTEMSEMSKRDGYVSSNLEVLSRQAS